MTIRIRPNRQQAPKMGYRFFFLSFFFFYFFFFWTIFRVQLKKLDVLFTSLHICPHFDIEVERNDDRRHWVTFNRLLVQSSELLYSYSRRISKALHNHFAHRLESRISVGPVVRPSNLNRSRGTINQPLNRKRIDSAIVKPKRVRLLDSKFGWQ